MKLCCETLKYRNYLDKYLEDSDISQILKTDGINGNKELARVVLYEMIFGKGLKFFNGKLKQSAKLVNDAVQGKKNELESNGITPDTAVETSLSSNIPRYARMNTLMGSYDEIINELKSDGWNIITVNVNNFNKNVEEMTDNDVIVDPHVKNLLAFPRNCNLYDYKLINDGKLILQDKASCLPAFVINPEPGSHVFDSCAAPGNKSSHLAAIMNNQGKVFACDLSTERTSTMKELMKKAGANIVKIANGDFLQIDVNEKNFNGVKYVVVDPPCSGSGIAKRGDFMSEKIDYKRIDKLHNLQVMLLRHAFGFPNVEKIVYSTCSIHEGENESVVQEILAHDEINQNFKLADPLPEWEHRGLDKYDFKDKVLRADPETDLTNGFFVALFQRKKSKKLVEEE